MGLSDQAGQEIDEFVVDTLRNNLLGLPLDLPTHQHDPRPQRGHPVAEQRAPADLRGDERRPADPYTDWVDFGQALKHPESLVNFVAAYGTHPTITGARRRWPASAPRPTRSSTARSCPARTASFGID